MTSVPLWTVKGRFMRIFVLFLLVLGFSADVMTQPPPPPAASGSAPGTVKKFAGWPSISSIPSTEEFASLEGRFKVALPKDIQGFGALSPKQTGSTATGQQLTWKFAKGDVVLFFLDFPDSTLTGTAADLSQSPRIRKSFLLIGIPMRNLSPKP